MRMFVVIAVVSAFATGAFAQEADKCAKTESWFKLAIDSRILGEPKSSVRRALQAEMGERKAANELADFVYLLPEEQLTPALAEAARAQCEAMPAGQ
ncbi:hypothetical protein [Antarctobacter jejuensis]|uniref:hypothetical protein n=1 Tax=Antarctobacter jejuensis TaxID=1439938 RepID=UPI003FD235C4